MFDIAPFPAPPLVDSAPAAAEARVGVVIPTRNRPDRLARCLARLAVAREEAEFDVVVCDSSGPDAKSAVASICEEYPFVRLINHERVGAAAARNVGTGATEAELLVVIDDDVYVAPHAIKALLDAYDREGGGRTVVAGEVRWSHWTSAPMRMRRIGFGRDAGPGEEPEFLVSALLLVPRVVAIELPWNERLWPYDDRYATMLWRASGSRLRFAADAKAEHDAAPERLPGQQPCRPDLFEPDRLAAVVAECRRGSSASSCSGSRPAPRPSGARGRGS